MLTQIQEDLKSIVSTAAGATTIPPSDGFLLTVISHDPKFLLTIGDRVKTSSCQNYRTGSRIETLLGYVIDAQIAGMVTLDIRPQSFETLRDFQKVKAAQLEGTILSLDYDGNLNRLRVNFNGGETVVSRDLGDAMLRRILKVGQSVETYSAGLFLEPAYMQNHPNLGQARDLQIDFVNSLAQEMEATTHGKIRIAGSKNPGGHYSDAAGGAKTSSYIVGR